MPNRFLSAAVSTCVLFVAFLFAPASARAANGRAIAAGGNHACAVTTSGGVKCWGDNFSGQLGNGTSSDSGQPAPSDVVGLTSGVASVAAGESHTCAVTTGGGVKCWGRGTQGQLGDGTQLSRTTPVDVSGLTSGVAAVAAGEFHTCALTTGGGVKCWGGDSWGQLGDGATTDRLTPVDVSGLGSGVAAIVAGSLHTCAITTTGGLKCWGANTSGQVGDGTTTNRLTPTEVPGFASGTADVGLGNGHTCAVTTGGGVKCWGDNTSGQLGDGTLTGRTTPGDVSGLSSGVAGVAVGGYSHTCVVLSNAGGIKCWGLNGSDQLGDGTTANRSTPVSVRGLAGAIDASTGSSHSCALTAGGGVKCWGDNGNGQLGDGRGGVRPWPVDVTGLKSGAATVSAGGGFGCIVTTGGALRCWGANGDGELGDGTTTMRDTPVDAAGLTSGVAAVATGVQHTCLVTTGGGLKCVGGNAGGQLGDGTTVSRLTAVDVPGLASGIAAVGVGAAQSCVRTTGGGVKCWGANYSGELGDGTTTMRLTPVNVSGLASGAARLSVGLSHSCVVTTGGGVKCWGANYSGELGDGTKTYRTTPVDVSGLTSGVAAVAAGGGQTCALTSGGGVKCWGRNNHGQLGDGTTADRSTPSDVVGLTSGVAALAAGTYHSCALMTSGAVKCWGQNTRGALGDGTIVDRTTPVDVGTLSNVASLAAGNDLTCAVTTVGAVSCWGWGAGGATGDSRVAGPYRVQGFGRPDFDDDDRADAAVFRPSAGTWFALDSSSGRTTYHYRGWGVQAQNDTPALGDFDGDGILDPTVFRPASGTWFILESHAAYTTWNWFGWGTSTDTLVPGDYDGDGVTDAAIYRPSTGTWYVRPSSGATTWSVAFGNATDVPIAGDFDGDGKRDPAVYRASTGTWFWLKSSSGYTAYEYRGWGVNAQGDTPAPGDFDGDGKTDLCVFRPGTGTWYVLESNAGYTTWSWFGWGTTGDTVAPGDYDGDGRTDAAIYRASTGTWYIRPSSGAAQWSVVFGSAGDLPLVMR